MLYPPENKYFKDDVERANWRWMLHGDGKNAAVDAGLKAHFNDAQRDIMQKTPAEALEFMERKLPQLVNGGVRERLGEAQARLFPPLIGGRGENVIFVNFRRAA